MIHERPPLPPEERINRPDVPQRWECLTCGRCFEVRVEAMHDPSIPMLALRIWDHYHLVRNGSPNTTHEILSMRLSEKPSRFPTSLLDARDLFEALAWWEGFELGQRVAAESLREPIERKLRELAPPLPRGCARVWLGGPRPMHAPGCGCSARGCVSDCPAAAWDREHEASKRDGW